MPQKTLNNTVPCDSVARTKTHNNMKKTLFILTLMLLGISSMSAQTLIGKWAADQDFKTLMEAGVEEDPNFKIDLVLHFTLQNLNLKMLITASDDGMTMKLDYTIPGTYIQSGKQVTAKYDLNKSELKVISIESDDPEFSTLLANKEMKDMIFKMINDQVKEQMKDKLNEMSEFTDIFKQFTIESITASKLKLTFKDNATIGFDRTN